MEIKEIAFLTSYNEEVKRVSELITNMFILGGKPEEIEQVVEYSMDVMDAYKSDLRCKLSRIDNNISEFEQCYGDEV